jgi:hypothetical protein
VRYGRRVAGLAILATLCLGPVQGAWAHDDLAPRGAPHHWLPKEDWVYRHWVPFDEQSLKVALGMHGRDLEAYLYDDHRSLARLAELRGIGLDDLVERLVGHWRGTIDPDRFELNQGHTRRLLTQGHLAQHVFFHVYHGIDARAAAPTLFGMGPRAYWHLRLKGWTPLRIAKHGGVSAAALRAGVIRLYKIDRDEGIRLQRSLPAEADRLMARQVARLGCWLRTPLPGFDETNPYGKEHLLHGMHSRRWPSSAAEWRAEQHPVAHFRATLARGCWPVPPAWSWSAHGLKFP